MMHPGPASQEAVQNEAEPPIPTLDINKATVVDWIPLCGWGSDLSWRIVETRQALKRFTSVDDLLQVEGIDAEWLNAIRDRLSVGPRGSQTTTEEPDQFDCQFDDAVFDPRGQSSAQPLALTTSSVQQTMASDVRGGFVDRLQALLPSIHVNRQLLLVSLLGIAALIGGVHALHAFQISRLSTVLHKRAENALAAGKPEQAIRWLHQFLAYHPRDLVATEKLGLVVKEHDESPRGQFEAYRLLESVVREAPLRHDSRRALIDLTMSIGRWADSLDYIQQLVQQTSVSAELKSLTAQCLEALGQYESAVEGYQSAILLDPETFESYVRAAEILQSQMSAPKRAEDVVNQMVANNRNSTTAYLRRAQFRRRHGHIKAAAVDLLAAIRLDPEELAVQLEAAEWAAVHSDLGLINPSECREHLERLLSDHTEEPRVYSSLAQLALIDQQPDRAEQWLRRGLEAVPHNLTLCVGLVELQLGRGDELRVHSVLDPIEHVPLRQVLVKLVEVHELMGRNQWRQARDELQRLRLQKSTGGWQSVSEVSGILRPRSPRTAGSLSRRDTHQEPDFNWPVPWPTAETSMRP